MREPAPLIEALKGTGWNGFVVPDFGLAVRDPLAATLAGVDVPALGGAGGRTAEMFTSGQVLAGAARRHRAPHPLRR